MNLRGNEIQLEDVIKLISKLLENGADPDSLVLIYRNDKIAESVRRRYINVNGEDFMCAYFVLKGETVRKGAHIIRLSTDKDMLEDLRILCSNNTGMIFDRLYNKTAFIRKHKDWVDKNNIKVGSKVKIREDILEANICYGRLVGSSMIVSTINDDSITCGSVTFPYDVLIPVPDTNHVDLLGKKVWASDYKDVMGVVGILKSIKSTPSGIRYEVRYGNKEQYSQDYIYVAPFVEEEEYTPFTFEESIKLVGCKIKHKNNSSYRMVLAVYDNGTCSISGKSSCSMKDLLADFTFLDGSPCGSLKSSTAMWSIPDSRIRGK